MGRPSRVCDPDLQAENFGGVYLYFCGGEALMKAGDLADFLETVHFAGSIAVNTDAGRVVTTIFLAGETVAEDTVSQISLRLCGRQNRVSLSVIAHRCEAVNTVIGRM
jgi:hypothetical protein